MIDEAPHETIERMVHDRAGRSDAEILGELRAFEPLPPETSVDWDAETTWTRACLLVALGDVVAERRLREGVADILECMCLGDPGEMMRGMRHSMETAVEEDWAFLARACIDRCGSPRAGARCWAVAELGVLRDAATLDTLVGLLDDPVPEVASEACMSLVLLVQDHPELEHPVAHALRGVAERRADVRHDALRGLIELEARRADG